MHTLSNNTLLAGILMIVLINAPARADNMIDVQVSEVSQTIVQVELGAGITPEAAANAMIKKAADISLKFVGRQRIFQQLRKRGITSGHLEVFQSCDLDDAHGLVKLNPIFAAFLPCRISMVEGPDGRIWLMTFNLDMIINKQMLTPQQAEIAIRVNQNMMKVLVAGATGKT